MPTFYGTAELQRAITAVWNASAINAAFKAYWNEQQKGLFDVLHFGEAGPSQPWPYCVYVIPVSRKSIGMAGRDRNSRREIRDTMVEFHVFAKAVTTTSGAELCAAMADQVRQVYGGHPTATPTPVPGTIRVSPGDEYPARAGDDEYKWILKYLMRADLRQATIQAS